MAAAAVEEGFRRTGRQWQPEEVPSLPSEEDERAVSTGEQVGQLCVKGHIECRWIVA